MVHAEAARSERASRYGWLNPKRELSGHFGVRTSMIEVPMLPCNVGLRCCHGTWSVLKGSEVKIEPAQRSGRITHVSVVFGSTVEHTLTSRLLHRAKCYLAAPDRPIIN